MKLLPRLISLACVLAALVAHAGEKPAGPATADAQKSAETAIPSSETAAQIKAMPACKATVEEHHACYSIFRTADGKIFSIGSPAATHEVVKFLEALRNGQSYEFPGVFLDYQKTNPTYETAAQLKTMPPCKATLEHQRDFGSFFSAFSTADGKRFYIDSSGASPEVTEFLKTLKERQTYEFPGAFLEYQKEQQR